METAELIRTIHAAGYAAVAVAYLMGLVSMFGCFLMLRKAGQQGHQHNADVKGIISLFFSAILMIYLGYSITAVQTGIFMSDVNYASSGVSNPLTWKSTTSVSSPTDKLLVLKFIQLLGLLAIIKSFHCVKLLNNNDRPENKTVSKIFGFGIAGGAMIDPVHTTSLLGYVLPFMGDLSKSMADTIG